MTPTDRDPPKPLPSNVELEQALLGAILVNNDAYHMVSGFLTELHFFEAAHQEIYRVMARAIGLGRKANPKTLAGSLPALKIGEISINAYVARLAAEAVTVAYAADYGRGIFELALQRDLQRIARDIVDGTGNGFAGEPIEVQLAAAEDALSEIRSAISTNEATSASIGEAAAHMIEAGDAARAGKIVVPSTGFTALDTRLTGGYRPGRLIVVAGRPGMGKTVYLCDSARRVAKAGYGVGVFSLEVDLDELSARVLASEVARTADGVEYRDILSGVGLDDRKQFHVREGRKKLEALPMMIDHAPGISIAEIEGRARMMREGFRRKGIKLGAIFIDYLGLIRAAERYRGNRVQELGDVVTAAKNMSKRLECAVVLLAQLNREVEKRDDKRPILSDLRDSGNIEEHADVVIMLYRAVYYLERSAEYSAGVQDVVDRVMSMKNDLELIVPKNRLGPTGTDKLYCNVGACSLDNHSNSNFYGAR